MPLPVYVCRFPIILVMCSGAKIEDMLLHWKGDYGKLESHHGYIQWYIYASETGSVHVNTVTAEIALQ